MSDGRPTAGTGLAMRIAYLTKQHPKVNHPVIGRELRALKNRGVEVMRSTIPEVDEVDAAFPAVVLCDYGKVLADFDRARTEVLFEEALGRPLPPTGARLLDDLLGPFEAGEFDPSTFLRQAREALGLADEAEEAAFLAAWCGILWTLDDTVALMRRVATRPRTVVHVVTNTDPLRLAFAREGLGLADLFAEATASFEDGVTPKGRDSSMWQVARARATASLGEEPALVVGIDDLAGNLEPALADGTLDHGVVHSDAAGTAAELAGLGLLDPA